MCYKKTELLHSESDEAMFNFGLQLVLGINLLPIFAISRFLEPFFTTAVLSLNSSLVVDKSSPKLLLVGLPFRPEVAQDFE